MSLYTSDLNFRIASACVPVAHSKIFSERILAARQNVLLAGLNYDAELKQFSEGLRTMTEVLETLTRLGEAQLREVRAIGDYQVSIIDLAFATGTLLGHSRVGWDTAVDGS